MKTEVKATHTPTPWRVDKNGFTVEPENQKYWLRFSVMSDDRKADAAYIVRAVNAHEELVEALKQAIGYIEDKIQPTINFRGLVEKIEGKELPFNMKQALAKAEGAE